MIISGDWLKVIQGGLEYSSGRQKAKAGRYSSGLEADRLLENAKARMAKGTRVARQERQSGDAMESDAIAAMAGQGSATDPVMIAKIKAKTNYNSLAALLQGQTESDDLEQQARDVRTSGELSASANMFAAKTNLLSGAMGVAGGSFADWMKTKHPTAVNPHKAQGFG